MFDMENNGNRWILLLKKPRFENYKDWKVKILCYDCHKESENIFNIIGIKCLECGGYNTTELAMNRLHK